MSEPRPYRIITSIKVQKAREQQYHTEMVYDDVTGSESSVICEFSYGKYCESNKAVLKDYITAITKTLINDLDFGFITTTILSGHEKQTNNTEVAQ